MATPGIITGGGRGNIFKSTEATDPEQGVGTTTPESGLGVFGVNPGSTPKYAFNSTKTKRDAEYRESMARLFIELPDKKIDEFLKTVSPQARPLAQVLATGTGTNGGSGTGFIDFLLTNAQETFQEKAQIVDTLTDNYVAFYSGQEPPLFQYSGTLLNTYQDDQRVWMLRLYREILRGTRLANRGYIAKLRYDSFVVSGYLETLALSLSGETDHTASSFAFTMRVKRMQVTTPALGAPTVVGQADTTVLQKNADENLAANQRNGATMPGVPANPSKTPASDPVSLDNIDTYFTLQEAGKTDAEIKAILATAASQTDTPEVDAREQRNIASKEGVDRVEQQTRGTSSTLTNPDAVTNDGVGGLTNVKGSYGGTDTVPLTKNTASRRRGARAA